MPIFGSQSGLDSYQNLLSVLGMLNPNLSQPLGQVEPQRVSNFAFGQPQEQSLLTSYEKILSDPRRWLQARETASAAEGLYGLAGGIPGQFNPVLQRLLAQQAPGTLGQAEQAISGASSSPAMQKLLEFQRNPQSPYTADAASILRGIDTSSRGLEQGSDYLTQLLGGDIGRGLQVGTEQARQAALERGTDLSSEVMQQALRRSNMTAGTNPNKNPAVAMEIAKRAARELALPLASQTMGYQNQNQLANLGAQMQGLGQEESRAGFPRGWQLNKGQALGALGGQQSNAFLNALGMGIRIPLDQASAYSQLAGQQAGIPLQQLQAMLSGLSTPTTLQSGLFGQIAGIGQDLTGNSLNALGQYAHLRVPLWEPRANQYMPSLAQQMALASQGNPLLQLLAGMQGGQGGLQPGDPFITTPAGGIFGIDPNSGFIVNPGGGGFPPQGSTFGGSYPPPGIPPDEGNAIQIQDWLASQGMGGSGVIPPRPWTPGYNPMESGTGGIMGEVGPGVGPYGGGLTGGIAGLLPDSPSGGYGGGGPFGGLLRTGSARPFQPGSSSLGGFLRPPVTQPQPAAPPPPTTRPPVPWLATDQGQGMWGGNSQFGGVPTSPTPAPRPGGQIMFNPKPGATMGGGQQWKPTTGTAGAGDGLRYGETSFGFGTGQGGRGYSFDPNNPMGGGGPVVRRDQNLTGGGAGLRYGETSFGFGTGQGGRGYSFDPNDPTGGGGPVVGLNSNMSGGIARGGPIFGGGLGQLPSVPEPIEMQQDTSIQYGGGPATETFGTPTPVFAPGSRGANPSRFQPGSSSLGGWRQGPPLSNVPVTGRPAPPMGYPVNPRELTRDSYLQNPDLKAGLESYTNWLQTPTTQRDPMLAPSPVVQQQMDSVLGQSAPNTFGSIGAPSGAGSGLPVPMGRAGASGVFGSTPQVDINEPFLQQPKRLPGRGF